ncbi:hypothetical protein AMS68_005201 [Peltaster fructicola]|uniref:GP-PDE domain-containing protein n=1 Tax=Peltaster fructicola TaxID=286661 RepID=A0A6H0XY71_9PEZI|nr:hypothetical protein AMS68_005201 [Peltaster fructicola]
MKFGQNLPHNQVPEWASAYIDYKALKKLIKSASIEASTGDDADLATFFYTLDRQLEDVDVFYNRKYAEFSRRLRLLLERYGMASKLKDSMDKDELQDLMGTLLELRGQYRKLQWYGEVNRRGFVKITKKLDKKIASSSSQSRYLATKVDPKPFATNNKVTLDLRAINEWLSTLNEVKPNDDTSSVHSGGSGSLHHVASKSMLRVSSATIEALEVALRGDDKLSLSELVSSATATADLKSSKHFILDLLHRAVTLRAMKSIKWLLHQVDTIDDGDDMNKRNCLHRLLLAFGRARALEENQQKSSNSSYITAAQAPSRITDTFEVLERDPSTTLGREDPVIKLLLYVLDSLSPQQRPAVIARDVYERTPLHYAAQYGLVAACEELLKHMRIWGLLKAPADIESQAWQDLEGYAPLHLAVIGGHYRTTKALLQGESDEAFQSHAERSGASLLLATSRNDDKIVGLLVQAGIDVNHCDERGESALHIAARFGHTRCVRILLDAADINHEIQEKNFGWTPLFVASVDGHLPVVDLLLAAEARADIADLSGWTPKEHAALRGHLDIARRLAAATPSPVLTPVANGKPSGPSSFDDRRSNGSKETNGASRVPEPLKEFGHRYLKEESMILVSLGTMDHRKKSTAVNLDSIALADAHSTQLDTALSVVVSAQGADGEASIIDLPVHENISTSPVSFTTKDPTKVKILFDLVPTYSGSTNKVIARAVAMLSKIKPNIGSNRMSLQGDLSVPLVAADTLDVIGSIDFNFLIITPFKHPNIEISEETTYWRSTSTMIIGHRGMGKNMSSKTSLQLGENTIQSFITAANLGASYVEFDVQLTKDLVPIIYHDFLVAETGADVPVHTLTLEQFLHIKGENKTDQHTEDRVPNGRVQRSYSLGGSNESHVPELKERMKHTRALKEKGFKANSRGDSIQSPFATLEEMFHKLPESVGFNIEMKYPMLFETEQHEIDTYAVELNTFVDQVLKLVYGLGQKRNIIFSSFHPDVCLLLAFKQPSIPVLFLTDAGASEVGDIRASSLQEAIRFASRWKLLGIVSAAEPMVLCPRLIRVVKESGLVCVTYGTLNNDVHNSRLQAQEGIDAVIVDSVLKVRKGLTDPEVVTPEGSQTNGAEGTVSALTSDLSQLSS